MENNKLRELPIWLWRKSKIEEKLCMYCEFLKLHQHPQGHYISGCCIYGEIDKKSINCYSFKHFSIESCEKD